MQQYREIKARYPQTILFFRMGDFYEMFEDDARLAARELGLTLTSRNNGGAAEVPLAGVPVKAGTEYLRRLIAKGHRVAICEQVEDPKLAKGLVRREVVETITPGTVLAEDWLERKRNNFLVALDPRGPAPGLAALDLSTGELALETVSIEDLASALARYEAPEVVLPAGCELTLSPGRGACTVTEREAWEFDPELAREDLARTFRLASLDGLGVEPGDRAAVGAAGALLRYARELKPGGLPHLARPRVVRRGAVLPLDDMTRRNLELVESLRPDGGVTGTTVLEVLDRTMTSMGARLLRRWLLAPLVDPGAINARLDAVEVLVRDPRGRDRVREALDGVRDLERLAGRAALGRATPRELGALRDSIARLPDVRSALDGLEARGRAAALEQAAEHFDLLADLGEELARALVERPPAQAADGDAIRPGYDRELDELKDARDGGKQYIASLQARERERTAIPSLKVGFNKVFGYYIEVTNPHKDRVPPDYERRQTLSGAERFVTPELKQYEAKVLGAEERIAVREAELVDALRTRVADAVARVQTTAGIVAELDVWSGLADLAHRDAYVRPEVTAGFTIELEASRHPVVERMMAREAFIPNDVRLDEGGRVILLTGPNMAGKSTLLRQVGLCVLLAQVGSFVPARRAVIGVVDRLFTRVGASDNLVRGQSTFMVEMSETSAILHGATARSLVLLDEIGRGTSTYDGVAIAWAVTEHLHNVVGCKTIFATHYHELTQLTEELAHARNFNVAVREAGDEIVFLHRLEPGGADRSYGIHVGQLAGLPGAVVGRAWEVLKLLEAGHHVARQPPPPAPDAQQLALFAPGTHPLVAELDRLDVNALSPLDALNRLAAWKKRLEEAS
ncbi:MAG: DNA mismatch repair protein MutS [Gemmatimonadetes bacterium 13_2_20CM_69_27]|nr:MAG: DNA mismatch repair protein MutS [Gemmatimonadetes bacterium 13_2_20CM_69_27]OLB59243.1 MAG: DNA mismatch repair protein MutS [Gemmatimonadetes bacterium 13_2_20CM_2_69_23]OLD60297.1 MAG: DNA mismatch repair protein MutS [Gemmatimonadetes bacterium 13_1_20CM_69_28]PYO30698.1 MAG: DNA mismatch repair protein MutS [Gemmatimonadota bacterium]PYP27099.1 MAG: DNA mismatch repair protein MutS [Gemmatimonadota bacterium]